jgi:hypothetical protein
MFVLVMPHGGTLSFYNISACYAAWRRWANGHCVCACTALVISHCISDRSLMLQMIVDWAEAVCHHSYLPGTQAGLSPVAYLFLCRLKLVGCLFAFHFTAKAQGTTKLVCSALENVITDSGCFVPLLSQACTP